MTISEIREHFEKKKLDYLKRAVKAMKKTITDYEKMRRRVKGKKLSPMERALLPNLGDFFDKNYKSKAFAEPVLPYRMENLEQARYYVTKHQHEIERIEKDLRLRELKRKLKEVV